MQNYRRGTRTADATGRYWAPRSRFGRPLRVPKRPTRARKKMSDKANLSPLTAQAPNYPRGGAAKALSGPKVKGGSPPADYLNLGKNQLPQHRPGEALRDRLQCTHGTPVVPLGRV